MPFSPLECQSSFRTTSNYISCRGRSRCRGSSTRVFSSIEPKWWNKRDIRDLPYDSALRALQAYHEENGDLAIPGTFVVPDTNEYPVEWHGVKLAKLYNLKWWNKHIAQHTDRVAELNQLGFIWERLQPQWNLFMEGISHYRNIYGNVMVPASFVVPRHDENWPKACWDLPLGSIVQRLRLRHDFLTGENAFQRKKQLDGVGFVWNVSEYKFTRFFRALRHFDRLAREHSSSREHSIRVPSKFEVPSGHEHGWPPDLWLYPLGAKCMAVRQKQLYVKSHPHRKQALEDIGFRWSGNAKLGWLEVVQAAAIYSQMHGRVLNVPFNFVIPTPPRDAESNSQYVDSWPWPERLWGLKLGQRLKDVRLKGAYLKGPDAHVRKAQLDNLGFVWNPKRGRRCYIEQDQREHD
eukprot:CAMPEP_0201875108 /NCGR_PEP_ID=MMETSP0902-20130614/7169_1 /ASSEMBLY_ACC=CAM_ASM_000551 /TAXON_ID=420261 /ORGANISM="Thalassiosira antarctica, Strain CCMP982" /LENGTH=405 /DNA_ID=CAMNT_0048402093 /DNA_START=186 /DNA_END=1403 /DNA_ORIENTATION=+